MCITRRRAVTVLMTAVITSVFALNSSVALADGQGGYHPDTVAGGQLAQPWEASFTPASDPGQHTVLCSGGGCVHS